MKTCSYPETGFGVVKTVFTDLAVIDILDSKFIVREMLETLSFSQLQSKTGAPLTLSDNFKTLTPPNLD
ncbi:MAG: hypothetical protein HOK89_10160 [Rhodospirillaceae bacterium]|nr:hypothetical protein [Rhodospirillaceae bacterium]